MPNISLYNSAGEEIGQVDLKEDVFNVKVNNHCIYLALKRQLANARSGCVSTKTRGDVRGGGKKPWRQKGTGRSRHGSRRSPIWKGGGVVFGPKPRDFSQKLPKKVRRLAIKSALTAKFSDGKCRIVDDISFEMPKTRLMVEFLEKQGLEKKTLVILSKRDENVEKSIRNIPYAKSILSSNLNIHDLLSHDNLVFTKEALKAIEEVLS